VIGGFAQNDFGNTKIQITLDELRKEKQAVEALGLLNASQAV
jgi:hypothetical protein